MTIVVQSIHLSALIKHMQKHQRSFQLDSYNQWGRPFPRVGPWYDDITAKDSLTLTKYVEEVVKIHHAITVVHPFRDGNGRVSRVMLNWIFKLKDLPPVYIKYDRKEEYFDGLKDADINANYEKLTAVFLKNIIYSLIELNEGFVL